MTTAIRARTGVDIFADARPITRIPARRRKCTVCEMQALAGDLCTNCRRDLVGLLASLTAQQDTIIARMRQHQIDLDLHISCASPEEKDRYAKLCKARELATLQHELGSNSALDDFNKRYLATQALPNTLGAIVRADARVCDQWRDVEALNALQRKVAAVELAIEGLRESEN